MTIDEAMARAEQLLDERIAAEMENNTGALIEAEVDDAGIEACRERWAAQYEAWKHECLAEMRRGLSDWDAPSGKLQ